MDVQAARLYPFVPGGKNFAISLAFFNAIGFSTAWQQPGIAGLRFGGAYFMLQDVDVQAWQENQMLVLEVDDLDRYHAALDALDLPARFPGAQLRPPTDFAWGREVHLIDPAGVCWHIRAAPAPASALERRGRNCSDPRARRPLRITARCPNPRATVISNSRR